MLYLVNGVTGFFSIIYVPSRLIVSGTAAATANKILASERLFRLGIVSELICAAAFIFLLCVLYRLLGGVNKTHASVMAFALPSAVTANRSASSAVAPRPVQPLVPIHGVLQFLSEPARPSPSIKKRPRARTQ